MSGTQQPRPTPPAGRASWLDYVLDPCQVPVAGEVAHARAELAELRKALAESQGKLAIATANAAELAQQRDSLRAQVLDMAKQLRGAMAKWDERLMGLRTYCAYCGHEEPIDADGALIAKHIATCEAHPMRAVEHERDSLRAKVAALRGAILGLGELTGIEVHTGWGGDTPSAHQLRKRAVVQRHRLAPARRGAGGGSQAMTPDELKAVLDAHAKYLRGEDGGVRANLSGADLRNATLCGADLRNATLCGADLRGADLRGANLRGANLCWADLLMADLRMADLRMADLHMADLRDANLSGAGILRIHADYEVTLYPGDSEPVLAYGCERHALSHWDREVEAITREHEEGKGEEHVTRRVAEIRALLALCRTVPQPVRAEATGDAEPGAGEGAGR